MSMKKLAKECLRLIPPVRPRPGSVWFRRGVPKVSMTVVIPHFARKPRTDGGSARPLACEGTAMRMGIAVGLLMLVGRTLLAADFPAPVDGDVTLRDFQFASGEKLPE